MCVKLIGMSAFDRFCDCCMYPTFVRNGLQLSVMRLLDCVFAGRGDWYDDVRAVQHKGSDWEFVQESGVEREMLAADSCRLGLESCSGGWWEAGVMRCRQDPIFWL